MVILEKPYVSELLLTYLANKQVPVLENAFSVGKKQLNLVDTVAARRFYESGQRIYTTSENALDWIYQNLPASPLVKAINVMKDKAAMRRLLSAIYPQYFFKEVALEQLPSLDIAAFPKPFILKPSVGFFSLGVYTIYNQQDWQGALDDIAANSGNSQFPGTVVNQAGFLLEEYIKGDEFAVDVYYDQAGQPVIVNIMRHPFAAEDDVRDRLYMTSKNIVEDWLDKFTDFFKQVNRFLKIKDFPAHVELRVCNNVIMPIEFNPMRFAGLCTTDIAYYAYGITTVDYFLNNLKPDFAKVAKPGKTYSMIIVEKPDPSVSSARFNYERLAGNFEQVLEMRKLDLPELPVFGIMFTETNDSNLQELDAILHADLREYLD